MMIIKIPRDKVEIFEIVPNKQELDECDSNDVLSYVKDDSESNLVDDTHEHIESNHDVPNCPQKELHNQIKGTALHSSTNSDDKHKFWCNLCAAEFYYEKHLVHHVTREHASDESYVDNNNILTSQNKDIFETVSVKKELGEGFSNDVLCEVKYSKSASFNFEGKIKTLEKEVPNSFNELQQNHHEVVKPNSIGSTSKSHVNNTVQSNTCTAEFQSKKKLAQPITKEHESKSLNFSSLSSSEITKCLFCPKGYKFYTNMLQHTRKCHPSRSCYRCLFCKNHFSSVTNLATHSLTVHSQSTHTCATCWKVYTSPKCLKAHMKICCQSSSIGKVQINCDICKKTFYSKETFEIHLRAHMGLSYPCTECSETFLHYKTMIRHKRMKHGNALKCKFCLKVFSDNADLNRHIIVHSGKVCNHTSTEKPFYCDLCGKKFSRKDHMRDHIRSVHMKEGVRCSHCSRSFATKSSLKRHKIQHSKKNVLSKGKYCCDLCCKNYADKRQLRDHLNKHYNR
uniref:Zinc finger protein 808 n=1 Tax=Cacopsylla melanoneura TaxID=428564 RepID=A0A8D8VM94_9HEMI